METVLPYFIIIIKSVAVYLFILFAIRLFGKKELAQLSVIDLVFILLISNSVQNAMVGSDSSLLGGLAAASGLFIANYILKILVRRFPGLSRAIQGSEIMLVYKGHILERNFERSMLTIEELNAVIREHGVKNIEEVDLAILEVDGNISVLSKDFQHKTTRHRKAHKALSKTS
jgi:uncharacterized membrane protein YcaP (DUF421 family)